MGFRGSRVQIPPSRLLKSKNSNILRTRGLDGRWTTDAWAPLEGRVINGGVRIDLGPAGRGGEGEPE